MKNQTTTLVEACSIADAAEVALAYRHLDCDFESGCPLMDANASGPSVGAWIFF